MESHTGQGAVIRRRISEVNAAEKSRVGQGPCSKEPAEHDSTPDSLAFWAHYTEVAALRVFHLGKVFAPGFPILQVLHNWRGDWKHEDGRAYLFLLPVLLGLLFERSIRRKIAQRPILGGVSLQISFHVWVQCWMLYFSTAQWTGMTETMRHRVFLTVWLTCFNSLSVFSYIPFIAFVCLVLPIYVVSWIVFHYSMDFVKPAVCVFLCIDCILCTLAVSLTEDGLWQTFRHMRALEKERRLLEATQATLHAMLSSLFDASCTCDREGNFLDWTPHLQQLLTREQDDGQELRGTQLSAFAASGADEERLKSFLKNAASSAIHQAAKIQVALHAPRQLMPARHWGILAANPVAEAPCERCQPFEAALYAIRLPGRGAGSVDEPENMEGSRRADDLFIGLQKMTVDSGKRRPESTDPVLSGNYAELHGAAAKCNEPGEKQSAASSDAEDTPALSTCTDLCKESAWMETFVHSTQAIAVERQVGDARSSCCSSHVGKSQSNHSLSFTWTLTNRGTSKCSVAGEGCQNASTQTEGSPAALLTAEACTQTVIRRRPPERSDEADSAIDKEEKFLSKPRLPPRMPSHEGVARPHPPGSRRTAAQHKPESVGVAAKTSTPQVRLGTSRCILPRFLETPACTIEHMIYEDMKRANIRGKGCCVWHISTLTFERRLRKLMARPCDTSFTPYSGWQCTACRSMNEPLDGPNSDEENEGEPLEEECGCCGMEKTPSAAALPGSTTDSARCETEVAVNEASSE